MIRQTNIWKIIQNWINSFRPDEIPAAILTKLYCRGKQEKGQRKTIQNQNRQPTTGITIIHGNNLRLPLQFVNGRNRIPYPRNEHKYSISHS